MTEYHEHGVTLSASQAKKIVDAHKKNEGVTLRISKNCLQGQHKLPLTQTQINKIQKAKAGVQVDLSAKQLKHMEKIGGLLPLLSLIPIIMGAVGAAGGLTGGIASAVSSAKSNTEQARHNRVIEEQLKSGSGIVSDIIGKVPVIGHHLKPLLQKIGLGVKDCNHINNGECICKNNFLYKKIGHGLFIEPAISDGSGLFLGPWKK